MSLPLSRERIYKQQHHQHVDEHCQRLHHRVVAADLANFRCVGQILLLIYLGEICRASLRAAAEHVFAASHFRCATYSVFSPRLSSLLSLHLPLCLSCLDRENLSRNAT